MQFASKTRRRESPAVNAGSMADIAFLLLIFFLVTTEIVQEKGLFVVLPAWEEVEQPETQYADDQVLTILVNYNDQLMVEGVPTESNKLKKMVIDHILSPIYPPAESIVSLSQDRGTSYATYLLIYNEVLAAYRQLRNERAQTRYGLDYVELDIPGKRAISQEIPMVLSEAEPIDLE